MPTDDFYPTAASEPVAGEGALIEGAGATSWTNIGTQFNTDSTGANALTDNGSLTPPGSGLYAPAATSFVYTATNAIGVGGRSRMYRLSTWRRVSDNADLATVLSSASAITALLLNFRISDADMGLSGVGGFGANSYFFEFQQRIGSGAIGTVVTSVNFFDYGTGSRYFYRPPLTGPDILATFAATLPTVAQMRDANYGINGRLGFNGDVIDNSPAMGWNGARMSLTYSQGGASPRQFRRKLRFRAN
jgi:hypothetical protein